MYHIRHMEAKKLIEKYIIDDTGIRVSWMSAKSTESLYKKHISFLVKMEIYTSPDYAGSREC